MTCSVCDGTGSIKNPTHIVTVIRLERNECGEIMEVEDEETIGGIDACPKCSFDSEVEYSTLKGKYNVVSISCPDNSNDNT